MASLQFFLDLGLTTTPDILHAMVTRGKPRRVHRARASVQTWARAVIGLEINGFVQ
jgi:hypothetical protein